MNVETLTPRMVDGTPAVYQREQASLDDPFEATHQTVRYMCDLVKHSLSDPIVCAAADDAKRKFGALVRSTEGIGAAQCCWWWCKKAIRFVHHQTLLGVWLKKFDELQLLISPEALLKMREPQGDCAVFSTLLCAMLSCCGINWEIVTVAVDPSNPGIFSHVYLRAVIDGQRIPLDASHGPVPGWEVPRERVSALQIWDSAGNPISDQDAGKFRGLHGGLGMDRPYLEYQYTHPFGAALVRSRRERGFPVVRGGRPTGVGCCAGLGDATSDAEEAAFQQAFGQAATSPNIPSDFGNTAINPTSSGSSFIDNSFFTSLANSGLNLIGRIVAPTTTLTTPSGLQLTTPASQTANASLLLGGSALGAGASNYMPIILLGGLAFVVLMAVKK